ncbi:hypothetical protein [Ectothiorhodospira variabilis]|nr:hypothetical protein [Ectothiorhodospira variabilis]
MRFIIHPLEGLPTQDPEVLFKLMLEGRVTDVAALKHFTLTD